LRGFQTFGSCSSTFIFLPVSTIPADANARFSRLVGLVVGFFYTDRPNPAMPKVSSKSKKLNADDGQERQNLEVFSTARFSESGRRAKKPVLERLERWNFSIGPEGFVALY
jgi:hypothetical protein